VIHFVDAARIGAELRSACGEWSDHVTWTTLRSAVTCLACARLEPQAQDAATPRPPRRRLGLTSAEILLAAILSSANDRGDGGNTSEGD
jgi:hypothetical protein